MVLAMRVAGATIKSHALLRRPEKPTQIESLPMLSRYDLFELTDGSPIWVGSANTIEEVKAQVRRRIAGAPQEWVVLEQVTGHKSVLTPKQLSRDNPGPLVTGLDCAPK